MNSLNPVGLKVANGIFCCILGIRLQDRQYGLLFLPMKEETLQDIYKTFLAKEPGHPYKKLLYQRNSVMLGLMVFQGLDSGDLERLTVKDINLREGIVYIATSRNNAVKTFRLESVQILSINHYMTHTRLS